MSSVRSALLVGLALAVGPAVAPPVYAQKPLRAALLGDPRVGHDAPDFKLPYFSVAGPGPADQPFHLRAELGRIVVLVLGGAPGDSLVRMTWDYLAAQGSGLFRPGVVVAGIVNGTSAETAALAAGRPPTFKFLPDSGGEVHRQYGVVRDAKRLAVFVVADDGTLAYRSRSFRVDDPYEMVRFRRALAP